MFCVLNAWCWVRHEPQFITTKQGKRICRFQIGTTNTSTAESTTLFFNVLIPAETKQYYLVQEMNLSPGDTVFISGQLQYNGLYNNYPNFSILVQTIFGVNVKNRYENKFKPNETPTNVVENQEVKFNNKKEVDNDDYDVWV